MQKSLEILRLLLEATERSILEWSLVDSRPYQAVARENRFRILFKYPLLAMDDGSDADIAEVHVPGLALTFFNGSEGFDLALRILEAGLPERAAAAARFERKCEAAIDLLQDLVRAGSLEGPRE